MASAYLYPKRKYIKLLMAAIFRYLGIFRLERLIFARSRAFILAFHRVVRDGEISRLLDPQMYVTAPVFCDLLVSLRRRYEVVPLAELMARDKSKRRRRKPLCALTFDDGYMDNYTNAFPVLREMQIHATIFLTAGLVGTEQLLWNDVVSIALARTSETARGRRHLHDLLSTAGVPVPTTPHPRSAAENFSARTVVSHLKCWPHARISALLSKLRPYVDWNGREARRFRLLAWDQVREMSSEGMRFGSHTLRHCILPIEDGETVWREVSGSKALIESKIGTPVDAIAYPNGSYNDEIVQMARQAGFRFGLTLRKGCVTDRSDLMRIRRVLVSEQDITFQPAHFCSSLFEYEKSVFVEHLKGFFLWRLGRRR